MRGEYATYDSLNGHKEELPPRARRIPEGGGPGTPHGGTTSACAENTLSGFWCLHEPWNYLRVRGEYNCCLISDHDFRELPPRARRILLLKHFWREELGTTSACAENTRYCDSSSAAFGNYLRVRGEYKSQVARRHALRELPPRARRILFEQHITISP